MSAHGLLIGRLARPYEVGGSFTDVEQRLFVVCVLAHGQMPFWLTKYIKTVKIIAHPENCKDDSTPKRPELSRSSRPSALFVKQTSNIKEARLSFPEEETP
jgi:hypothetical protein